MLNRLAANTQTLQKQFPGVYREFFAASQRVASASNSFLWTGEFSGFYGGITVSQKLPIRSYVGLETTFDAKVAIDPSYTAYDAEKQEFVSLTIDTRLAENLHHYLEQHLASRSDFTGVKVHILTEIPLGHSLGSNGAIAAALALLLADQPENFEQVFEIARDILSLSQAGHSSGVTAYMALTASSSPTVFFSDDETYYAKTIDELAGLTQSAVWPIDFGLIYSGVITNAEGVILANNQTISELEADTQRLDTLLTGKQQLNFRKTYTDMLNMTASLTVLSLVELFTKGSKNSLLEQLFNSLNEFQNLLHILHVSNGATDLIYSRVHQVASKQTNDVGSGVKISGIGKGGAVLFAVPYGTHRTALVEMVEELREQTGRAIWLDYASWLDGIGGEAGKVEQDITHGVQSSFIDHDAVSLILYVKGVARQEVVTRERFNETLQSIDLLLDKTTGKVLVGGLPVTSKEVMSQKATVSIITDLLKTPNLTLSNTDLPTSYGTSRYDLQGKIVLPLAKCIKELTSRDLQLTVRGGMYDEYELHLDPSNITIGVLEKKN